MHFTTEQIKVPMMDGSAKPFDVLSFNVRGVALSVRKVGENLCYILHRATGLKVTSEWTGDVREAAQGFADTVALGAIDMGKIIQCAKNSPVLNGVPS